MINDNDPKSAIERSDSRSSEVSARKTSSNISVDKSGSYIKAASDLPPESLGLQFRRWLFGQRQNGKGAKPIYPATSLESQRPKPPTSLLEQ